MMLACSLPSRVRGLLFRKDFHDEMLICPCRSIHTFGMERSIDVAFIDRFGSVLRCKGACAVIERVSIPGGSWYERGQCLQSFSVSIPGSIERRIV